MYYAIQKETDKKEILFQDINLFIENYVNLTTWFNKKVNSSHGKFQFFHFRLLFFLFRHGGVSPLFFKILFFF